MNNSETPETYLMTFPVGTTFVDSIGDALMTRTEAGYDIAGEGPLDAETSLDWAAEILCTTIGIKVA